MISSLQLARLCGLSQGTVDRALHNRPGICPATRQRILDLARKHGYRPHPLARELLAGERNTVGAIIPALNSLFFLDLMNEIRNALMQEGWRLFLCAVTDENEFQETLADFAARRCRAAIVIPPRDHLPLPASVTADMPVVSLLSPCQGTRVTFLTPDEVMTGRDAVAYLMKLGHRRILHVTYARRACAIRDRAKGYRVAMREHGQIPRVLAPLSASALLDAVRRHQPTALFCHNDWLALSALRILAQAGIRIPDDISVLGVDNSPTFSALCPDITTMQYPVGDIAQLCRRLLRFEQPRLTIGRLPIIERRTVVNYPG
ncbi:MAG: LacI family transcriptional regulator [Verrucomicrobia bacterium]|nr:LacI family transcriptional regulator [Verrucomicrobiota bacterium]MCG2681424.1 LacI family transcriptional regulator [Kiritimatiellia bacterium]MBU4248324.1 LacI family transcriptional regulator [Verrucomicrobiota bacterium]MBU4289851.1 LacI family transcriptional regulator [Verrucomicrobiota bacterium]MBU4430322.1 LacI family transcriptional regulator [Verrucomicrobiota bacterium]